MNRKILVPTALVCALVVVFYVVGLRESGFRRFVSKPLPDGTRYTFLYPDYLTETSEDGVGASPQVVATVSVYTPAVKQSRLNLMWSTVGIAPSATAERITVIVVPARKVLLSQSRQHEEWVRGAERRRNEIIFDARSKMQFSLFYSVEVERKRQYDAHQAIVAKSFQVLPPAVAPPNP